MNDIFEDKSEFKQRVQSIGICVPRTIGLTDDYDKWAEFWKCTGTVDSFVIKPNNLSQGQLIYIVERRNGRYYEIDGTELSQDFLEDVGFQILSACKPHPKVLIEERIRSHKSIRDLYGIDKGIADIRIYMRSGKVMGGRLRTPTVKSRFYSNWSRCAAVFHISENGTIVDGREIVTHSVITHPDTGKNLEGKRVPFWGAISDVCKRVSGIMKVECHTVDLTVNEEKEVVVIEGELTPDVSHMTPQWQKHFGYEG